MLKKEFAIQKKKAAIEIMLNGYDGLNQGFKNSIESNGVKNNNVFETPKKERKRIMQRVGAIYKTPVDFERLLREIRLFSLMND